MNRKRLIEDAGGVYRNYRAAYSFENPEKREIYFGAWDHNTHENGVQFIFSLNWKYENGSRKKGFGQAERCIDLILNGGFKLLTFTMKERGPGGRYRHSIESVSRKLVPKRLFYEDRSYYAYPEHDTLPAKGLVDRKYIEGAKRLVEQTLYERNPEARQVCLKKFGFACRVCEIDFSKVYGAAGAGYIHVHHLELVSKKGGEYEVDPAKDLRPICPNCHAIIHKRRNPYSINDVRKMIGKVCLEPDE